MPTTVITTPRLLLRSTSQSDFDQLFALIFSDGQVMKHLTGSPLPREQAAKVFDEVFDHDGTGRKPGVLVELQTERLLGYAGLMPCSALDGNDYELGFVLRREAWGKGYAKEIGVAQLEYGFRTTDRDRLLAQVRPSNMASVNALRKLGMSFVKEYERPQRGTWQVFSRARGASPFLQADLPMAVRLSQTLGVEGNSRCASSQ